MVLFGTSTNLTLANEKSISNLTYSHQQADGFRMNSQMRRDFVQINNKILVSEKTIVG